MTHADVPRISVIVPVWNRPDDIARCLASLVRQSLPADLYEVIVVDNGSTDNTIEVARGFSVEVLVEPMPGSYAARNRGLAAARGRYVAFTDSDCSADEHWLENGLRALEQHPQVGVVVGRIELSNNGEAVAGLCNAYERTFAFNQERNASRGRAVTANWFSSTSLLRELGGFRGDLKSGGDFEMAKRIQAAGRSFHYAPDVLVFHPARASFSELSRKVRRVIGGHMTMVQPMKRNPLGWWYGVSIDCARRLLILSRSKGVGIGMKLRLALLILALFGVSALEVALICLGGKPRRA